MNYTEALDYIHSVNWCFCKPGLERISELCRQLGDPQHSLSVIHVAGTNGKGSFCAMLDSVLRAAGKKVGLYTSPYIRFFNERMCVNGEPITDEELAAITSEVRPIADAMTDKPTEFELITAIAFVYFKRHACDVVILEAGMGGRLDSTNVIRHPLLSVITGIALDHTAYLGDTVEKIAAEKAGIIKDHAPILYGGDDAAAEAVICATAERQGSSFTAVDYTALSHIRLSPNETVFDFGAYANIKLSLLGLYQPRNASVVVCAVELLRRRGMVISDAALRRGLATAVWHGRFERLCQQPQLFFDGAHNPQGIAAATESIRAYFPDQKVYVLTGVLRDKDYSAIARDLATVASRAFVMTPENPRALSAEEYAATLAQVGVEAVPYASFSDALDAALAAASADGVPLFCLGSLYTYATLLPALKQWKERQAH